MDGSSSSWAGLRRAQKEAEATRRKADSLAGYLRKGLDINAPVLAEMRGGTGHPRRTKRGNADQARPPQKSQVIKR